MSSNPSLTRSKVALRRARPTTAQGPRFGVVGSILFHGAIVGAALFSFHTSFVTPEETHMVPVDLVTIADKTNVAAQAPPAPPPEKLDVPVPAREAPPEPDMMQAEPAPDMPVPKFDIAKEKPKPEPKVPDQPKPPTKKEQQADFDSLINNLTKPDKPVKNAKAGPRTIQAVGLGTAMTADIADALRAQIRRCWSLQIFPPNPADAIVDYDLQLTRDGRVASLELLTRNGNSFTRASAEAASRAIYQCQPYSLPQDRYNVWSEVNPLRFDPRQMLEQ
jgi:outer membrane biosynthesis protein TonB